MAKKDTGNTIDEFIQQVADAAKPYVEKAKPYFDRVEPAINEARAMAEPKIKEAMEKAEPTLKKAKAKAEEAMEKAEPTIKKAKEKAEPTLKKAKEKAEPVIEEAKSRVSKAATKTEVFLQYNEYELRVDDIVEKAREDYFAKGGTVSSLKQLHVYIKPEDNAAYYVANQDETGKVIL